MMLEIYDRASLENLPDGTIIEWLRVEDDRTSRAVAFVNVEIDYETPTPHGGPTRVVWISPGGWAPMTVDLAGINYPVKVVQLGPFRADHMVPDMHAGGLITAEFAPSTVTHLGPPDRHVALECAARVWEGKGGPNGAENAIDTAERFLAWLRDDDDEEAKP
ncbi:hypothetical protein PBI_PIPEFISH_63 [Mycobacterium phage Pipefish]|uniref:Uncharacterized protein n=1 Tax=Mycobacterium phage Pipefish TaxID=373413 RepID=Q19YU2_9CAUD|nr:gp63 [Mycobacterium phage Pipefish]ABD58560.1 hypothetical protein PBI_PIPEFISH_63 [Mycobacterium phage Pipefish]